MKTILASTALKGETLVHRLHQHALERPEQTAFTFLRYGETGNDKLSYGELDRRSRAIGAHLLRQGANGKPVLLLFPSGLEYIAAYLGCLYAGALAIPAYVPHSVRDWPRIRAIATDAQADFALITTADLTKASRWITQASDLGRLTWITTDSLTADEAEPWQDSTIGELAFLQYTSGSTTAPKGVMVSHGNLMHNLSMIYAYWQVAETPNPIYVSWLPFFHDMGLIMSILFPLYGGFPGYLMAPTDFLQRPLRWLQAISDYRGTLTSAPNFAYEYCLQRISAQDLPKLDLSCWEGAVNAAETVRSDTIERFTRFFATCGFPQNGFRPSYGLAEATLVVTSTYKKDPPCCIKTVSMQRLEENVLEIASESEQAIKTIVGCGRPAGKQHIVIVDPETLQRCESTHVGEIWISGPSVAQGYWRRPQETAEFFQAYLATGEGPFLRTGDLGAIWEDNLFITGRKKDLIILGGRNLYPQDIELTVEQAHPAIRSGCCAAFAFEQGGEERLIILAEIDHRYRPPTVVVSLSLEGDSVAKKTSDLAEFSQVNMQEIVKHVRRDVSEHHGVRAHQVLLLKIGGVLKTSSGKVQRQACSQAFLQGTLKTWQS